MLLFSAYLSMFRYFVVRSRWYLCCVYFDQTKPDLNFGQNIGSSYPKDAHFVTQLWLLTFATVASQNAHLWGGWTLRLGQSLRLGLVWSK